MPELRKALDEHPEYFARQGDLSVMAETVWLKSFVGKNLFMGEVIERDLASLRRELTHAEATPVERLMVDNVVSCWRELQFANMLHAGTHDQPESARKNLMKRQESAQRRYENSLQQLDKIQKRRPAAAKSATPQAAAAPPLASAPAAHAAGDDPLAALGRAMRCEANGGTAAAEDKSRAERAAVAPEFPRISPDYAADALVNGVGVDG